MAKRKEEAPPAGAPAWMSTYGDMVTLLLCFFVLLFAMSTIDVAKFQALVASAQGTPTIIEGGARDSIADLLGSGIMEMPRIDTSINQSREKAKQAQEELKQMASQFKTYFAQNQQASQIEVKVADESIIISFPDGILFDLGKAQLRPEALAVLDIVAGEIGNYPDNDVVIEGHTDNLPINTVQFPSNWDLSSARAISVGKYFINQKGIDPARISAVGRGEYQPLDTNTTPEGRARNRRVEIKVKSRYYSNTGL